jgi:hypothetical protein
MSTYLIFAIVLIFTLFSLTLFLFRKKILKKGENPKDLKTAFDMNLISQEEYLRIEAQRADNKLHEFMRKNHNKKAPRFRRGGSKEE